MGNHSGWMVDQVCGRGERTEESQLLGAIAGPEGWKEMR